MVHNNIGSINTQALGVAIAHASRQASANAGSFPPDVIVTKGTQSGSSPQPIALAQGQRLEMRLMPSFQWQLSLSDPDHTLASTASEG